MTIDYTTPLIEVSTPRPGSSLIAAIVANCYSIIGLSSGRPETIEAFRELCGPGISLDVLRMPFGAGGISTCGLVAEGIHRRMGVDAETLYQKYEWGSSIARAISYADDMGAWNLSSEHPNEQPGIGAYCIIGTRTEGENIGGIEHAFTVFAINGDVFTSVDGGQVCENGLQCAKAVDRRLVWRGNRRWFVDAAGDPASARGRVLLGWIDPLKLRYRGKMIVPQGWGGVPWWGPVLVVAAGVGAWYYLRHRK